MEGMLRINSLLILALLLTSCTETVVRRRPVDLGTESAPRHAAGASEVEALEARTHELSKRIEVLYQTLSLRLRVLEAQTAAQSVGIKILAQADDPSTTLNDERALFAELSRLTAETRSRAIEARDGLRTILTEVPADSKLAQDLEILIQDLERGHGIAPGSAPTLAPGIGQQK
jgi:hypothetical protein